MQLEILTFCDAAAEYGGRLNLIGATDTIWVNTLPAKYPRCAVVLRFRISRIEEGQHDVRLIIVDADGRTALSVDGRVDVRLGQSMTGAVNMIVNINTLELKEPGEYAVDVAVNGMQLGSSPLFVKVRSQEQSG